MNEDDTGVREDICLSRTEDIALVRNQGLDVDDDNEPALENIPDPSQAARNPNELYEGQTWGWKGIDQRKAAGISDVAASFQNGWTPVGKDYYDIFLKFFPLVWFHLAGFVF